MKKAFTFHVFAIILIAFLSSCKKDAIVADPEGTITVTLNDASPLTIYQGIDSDPMYPSAPDWVNLFFQFGMSQSTLNAQSTINVCLSSQMGSQCAQIYNNIDVANLGNVSGLGNVTTKPSSGYLPVSAIQKGHGYVIRYRKTHDQSNTNFPYYYARFYVVDWLTSSITGGVIGATIKYQNPF